MPPGAAAGAAELAPGTSRQALGAERPTTKGATGQEGELLGGDEGMNGARKGLQVDGAIVGDIAVNVVDVPARWNRATGGDLINEAVE